MVRGNLIQNSALRNKVEQQPWHGPITCEGSPHDCRGDTIKSLRIRLDNSSFSLCLFIQMVLRCIVTQSAEKKRSPHKRDECSLVNRLVIFVCSSEMNVLFVSLLRCRWSNFRADFSAFVTLHVTLKMKVQSVKLSHTLCFDLGRQFSIKKFYFSTRLPTKMFSEFSAVRTMRRNNNFNPSCSSMLSNKFTLK